jgi:Phage-related minor tail protein
MSEAVIGALRAILGIDTANFSKGLSDAEKSLQNFQAVFNNVAKKLAITAVATKFVTDVKGMIDTADELAKASEKFGVPIETLSALKYAAENSEVSFESLEKGLGKLSKAMFGATDPADKTAKAFKAIGVSVTDTDGNLRSVQDVFLDTADKFAKMDNGGGKAALAIKLFGKAGADLVPLLNKGRDGIEELTAKAAQLGIIISGETALKAQQFNETLKDITAASNGLALLAAENLLPILQKIADAFLTGKQNGSILKDIVSSLVTQEDLQELQTYSLLWSNLILLWAAAKATDPTEGVFAFFTRMKGVVEANQKSFNDLKNSFVIGLNVDNLNAQINMLALTFRNFGKDSPAPAIEAAKNALDKFIESQQKGQAGTQAQIQTVGGLIGAHEALKVTLEAQAVANNTGTEATEKQRLAIKALADQAAANAVNLAAVQMKFSADLQTPMEIYEKKLRDLIQIQGSEFPLSAEKMALATLKAWVTMQDGVLQSLSQTAAGFSQLFMTIGAKNKQMFEIGKAFAIAEATINTYKAANQALTAPPGPPVSYVYVAGAIAAGIANVIKIASTKMPSAAKGGSFMVGGGATGVDSKLVRMNLSPGERVDVTPANQVNRGGGSLVINPIRPKDFFTGDTVREMVLSIDEWMRNGGTGVRFAKQ